MVQSLSVTGGMSATTVGLGCGIISAFAQVAGGSCVGVSATAAEVGGAATGVLTWSVAGFTPTVLDTGVVAGAAGLQAARTTAASRTMESQRLCIDFNLS
jgi:hypothetical protein